MVKIALASLAAVTFMAGCATQQPASNSRYPAGQRAGIGYVAHVLPKSNLPTVYMLISPAGDGWNIDGLSSRQPQRTRPDQEIILTNSDLKFWTVPLPSVNQDCDKGRRPDFRTTYDLCTSSFGSSTVLGNAILTIGSAGTVGVVQYATDRRRVEQVIQSVSQAQVEAMVPPFVADVTQRQARAEVARKESEDKQRRIDEQAAREKNERERALEIAIIAKMSARPRGEEDRCTRAHYGRLLTTLDPEWVDIRCQFSAFSNLRQLQQAGWIIVNKEMDHDGLVNAYLIRKVR